MGGKLIFRELEKIAPYMFYYEKAKQDCDCPEYAGSIAICQSLCL